MKTDNEKYDSKNKDSVRSFTKVFPCSNYFIGLRDVMSKATKSSWISSLELKSQEFSFLIRAAKQVKELVFSNCKFLTCSAYDFGQMENWKIELLRIVNYHNAYSDLQEYEDSLMEIFSSIINCTNLITSLTEIRFDCSSDVKIKLLEYAKEVLGDRYNKTMPIFTNIR